MDSRRSASEPAFAEIGHSACGLSGPEAACLLWGAHCEKQTLTRGVASAAIDPDRKFEVILLPCAAKESERTRRQSRAQGLCDRWRSPHWMG